MEDPIYWSWVVAVYLFVAGVSAGAFFISASAYFIDSKKYGPIIKIGAYIAPFPLIAGIICLIYDLERPYLFWKLLLTFQPASVMSIGTWILLLFSILSFFHLYIWLPDKFDLGKIIPKLCERSKRYPVLRVIPFEFFGQLLRKKHLTENKGMVAGLGIILSIGVGIYTGILLGVVNARPFWNSPILPLVFLISALKTGTASISLTGILLKRSRNINLEEIKGCSFFLQAFDFALMISFLIVISLYIFGFYVSSSSYVKAIQLIMGGEFTFSFWVLVIGLGTAFPLIFSAYELIPHFNENAKSRNNSPLLVGLSTAAVLFGGFVLRYVVVYAGQVAGVIAA